mmetsp:Transcript_17623/g.22986  ORF Transcript_17623/g.22986 Transcript_17623/m.22986 type:complete len:93 (+) Transcript_17623:453-731(+)
MKICVIYSWIVKIIDTRWIFVQDVYHAVIQYAPSRSFVNRIKWKLVVSRYGSVRFFMDDSDEEESLVMERTYLFLSGRWNDDEYVGCLDWYW